MTIQFLTKMLQPGVNVIVRAPIGNGYHHVLEEAPAKEMAEGTDEFYQTSITDFFFRKDDLIITVEEIQ